MKTLRNSKFAICVCAGISFCLGGISIAQTRAPQNSAAQLESETLYHIAEFVEWPEAASRPGATFNFCVLGQDPLGSSLDEAVLGRPIGEKPAMILRASRMSYLTSCNILFISSSETARLAKILSKLRNKSIVTVSESPDFAASGGIIQLLRSGDRINLLINVDAAQRAGLRLRAQLLSLARIVHDDEFLSTAGGPRSREIQ